MKKLLSIMLGLTLLVGSATVAFSAQDGEKKSDEKKKKKKKKEPVR